MSNKGMVCAFALFLLLGAAAAQAAVREPRFVVPSMAETVGVLPREVVAGDFNADGIVDAAVANQGPPVFHGGVAVALGTGTGAWGAVLTSELPDGWGACDVAPSDFDADGRLDLGVLGCSTGGYGPMFILRGTGDGSFTVRQELAPTPEGQLVAADFNNDGIPDLAFSSRGQSSVRIFLGVGDGTVAPPIVYTSGSGSWDLATADVNVDGLMDLVGASGGSVWTMINRGGGVFDPQVPGAPPMQLPAFRLVLGRFDGDAFPDVALVDASGGHVFVGLGVGDGRFTPVQQVDGIARQAVWIAAGDFTGDGLVDLAANGNSNTVAVLAGRGDGRFSPPRRWITGSMGLLAVQLDRSGPTDLLSFSQDPGTVYAALATASGLRAPELVPTEVGGAMDSGDLNADARRDMVTGGGRVIPGVIESVIASNLQTTPGRFGAPQVSPLREETALSGVGSARLADFDEDGRLDILGGFTNFEYSPHNLYFMRGNGDGSFSSPFLTDSGDPRADINSLGVADVNADGHLDAVAYTLTQLAVRLGDGTGSLGPPILSGRSAPGHTSTLLGDVTGDGVLDAVVVIDTGNHDFTSSDVLLQQGHGDGTFTLVQTIHIDSSTTGAMADLNRDGRPDVSACGSAGSNGGRNGLFVFLTTPDGRLGPPTYYPRGFGAQVVTDLNADGAPEIVVDGIQRLVVNLNAGDGTFPTILKLPSAGSPVLGADFTGDRSPDVVTRISDFYPPSVAVYVNAALLPLTRRSPPVR